jgi:hypothetical protein
VSAFLSLANLCWDIIADRPKPRPRFAVHERSCLPCPLMHTLPTRVLPVIYQQRTFDLGFVHTKAVGSLVPHHALVTVVPAGVVDVRREQFESACFRNHITPKGRPCRSPLSPALPRVLQVVVEAPLALTMLRPRRRSLTRTPLEFPVSKMPTASSFSRVRHRLLVVSSAPMFRRQAAAFEDKTAVLKKSAEAEQAHGLTGSKDS